MCTSNSLQFKQASIACQAKGELRDAGQPTALWAIYRASGKVHQELTAF